MLNDESTRVAKPFFFGRGFWRRIGRFNGDRNAVSLGWKELGCHEVAADRLEPYLHTWYAGAVELLGLANSQSRHRIQLVPRPSFALTSDLRTNSIAARSHDRDSRGSRP